MLCYHHLLIKAYYPHLVILPSIPFSSCCCKPPSPHVTHTSCYHLFWPSSRTSSSHLIVTLTSCYPHLMLPLTSCYPHLVLPSPNVAFTSSYRDLTCTSQLLYSSKHLDLQWYVCSVVCVIYVMVMCVLCECVLCVIVWCTSVHITFHPTAGLQSCEQCPIRQPHTQCVHIWSVVAILLK